MTEEGLKMASRGKKNDNGLPVFGKKGNANSRAFEGVHQNVQTERAFMAPSILTGLDVTAWADLVSM